MKKVFLVSLQMLVLTSVFGQISSQKMLENSTDFVEKIKKANHFDLFHQQEAVSFDIELTWGGKSVVLGTITSLTGSGKIKLQKSDGKTVIFDGKKTWVSPANVEYSSARFDIFTYHYFFMVPFKVSDGGTNWEVLGDKTYDFNDYARAKLTFQKGTGDSADDWYIAHRNKATNYLEALSYIVTYGGKSKVEAEKKPGSIVYSDWKTVEGVQFATTWKFMNWSEETGFTKQKGEGKIKNIRFLKVAADTFAVPLGSKEMSGV